MAIVGNKSDDYENEKVKDIEGKTLARKLNAVFQRTSAKNGSGIDELFKTLGKHFLNPDASIISNLTKEEIIKHNQKIQIEEIKAMSKKKKKCC
jgi:Fe2+ transport system protein B